MARAYNVGVDIGGTFTDSVIRSNDGYQVFDKAFTTPGSLVDGVVASLENAAQHVGVALETILASTDTFKVGTTSPINRLINKTGAKVALLTTKGHEDATLIGRVQQKLDGLSVHDRSDLRRYAKPDPLVPRSLIFGLEERVDSSGDVLRPLRESDVAEIARECLSAGVEAFAVCYLWSFMNSDHEEMTRKVINRLASDAFVVLSSRIAPVIGEYERAMTTVLNAYLGPGTVADLHSLEASLRSRGLASGAYVMQSNGGVASADHAVARPVYLLGSGPVGGVAASRRMSQHVTNRNVIATDMGGTSFDVGVVSGGHPVEIQVSIHERYRVLASAIEVTSIGAGGGSIASVDAVTGVLQVGPESAGSMPGPVCYGFGGNLPTVTDANAVLGRLQPDLFYAGRRTLDVDGARVAIGQLADLLGVTPEEAASAIVDIVDSKMSDLIRNLTTERGLDPRDFTVVAYGGGGPLHVGSYARQIGSSTAIIPRAAPVFSAWGIADSPVLRTYSSSSPRVLPVPSAVIRETFEALVERMSSERAAGAGEERSFHVDMRYRYQLQELAVPMTQEDLAESDISSVLLDRFERMYEGRFGRGTTFRDASVEISTFRVVSARAIEWEPGEIERRTSDEVVRGMGEVWFGSSFQSVPVYDADLAGIGFQASGPCVIAGKLTTAIVHDGQSIEVDERGDFRLDLSPELS